MKFSKIHIFIFITSFALTTFIVWFFLPTSKSSENIYFRQGYDFRQLRLNNWDIALKLGDKLDITKIKNSEGKSLSSFSREKLFLLVAVDPSCPACNYSKDMMENIRKTTESIKVPYYPISITPNGSSVEMQKYAHKLGFDDDFYWSSESSAPSSLLQVITPTHILVDKDGTILQIWFGSNNDEKVRERMSEQISSDLLLIHDVFQVSPNNQIQNSQN